MIRLLAALVALGGLGAAWWQFTDRVLASDSGPLQDQPEFPLSLSGALPEESTSRDLYECWLGDEIVLARAPALGRDSLPRFAEEPGVPKFKNIERSCGPISSNTAMSHSMWSSPTSYVGGAGAGTIHARSVASSQLIALPQIISVTSSAVKLLKVTSIPA